MGGEKVPRRLRRFHRTGNGENGWTSRESGKRVVVRSGAREAEPEKGFLGIASEEHIQDELLAKKGKMRERLHTDMQASAEELDQQEAQMGETIFAQLQQDTRERAKELARGEVKRFRDQNDRLPMRTEYDDIAENSFSQLQKEDAQGKQQEQAEREHARKTREEARKQEQELRRNQRYRRGSGGKEAVKEKEQGATAPVSADMSGLDIKDLLSENSEKKKDAGKKNADEFDLPGMNEGLDDDFSLPELDEDEAGKKKKKKDSA